MKIADIAEQLNLPRVAVQSAIACARSDHPSEFFRVARYEWQEAGSGPPIAFYEAAAGKDARKPRASKERINAQHLAHYHRHKASINARRTAKRTGTSTPRNPWMQLAAPNIRHTMTARMGSEHTRNSA